MVVAPDRQPAAAPDHPRPAALQPQRERQLAAHGLQGRCGRLRALTCSRPHAPGKRPRSTAAPMGLQAPSLAGHRAGMLDSWLDLVHGATCVGCARPGTVACAVCCRRPCPIAEGPVRPTPCPDGLAACFAAGEYDDLAARHAPRTQGARHLLAGRAAGSGARRCGDPRGLDPTGVTVLVPVPSRPQVVRARGHDPVLRMARVAARLLRRERTAVQVAQVLEQRGAVDDQAGLNAGQRAANLAGSMGVRATARAALARFDAAGCPCWSATTS